MVPEFIFMILTAGYLGLFCQRARCCCTQGYMLIQNCGMVGGAAAQNSGYKWAGVKVGDPADSCVGELTAHTLPGNVCVLGQRRAR